MASTAKLSLKEKERSPDRVFKPVCVCEATNSR